MQKVLNLPTVSIVVTSYNYGQYIEDCLNGILNQTYRPLECIIVEDCSTDNSVEIIQDFIKKIMVVIFPLNCSVRKKIVGNWRGL